MPTIGNGRLGSLFSSEFNWFLLDGWFQVSQGLGGGGSLFHNTFQSALFRILFSMEILHLGWGGGENSEIGLVIYSNTEL